VTVEAFVTDTHPLVWFAAGKKRKLGAQARSAFEAVQEGRAHLYVPTPVVVETWFLARAQLIVLETSLERWWRRLFGPTLHFAPMDEETIFRATSLNWAHPDVYDRLIVSTALGLGLPLATADRAVSDWGGVEILW
jgi:PIN domain nuclease of toxin-antitoxin system